MTTEVVSYKYKAKLENLTWFEKKHGIMSMQQLLARLPQVREWILKTLEQHKALARPVSSYGFTRLPQYYSADTLASTVVVEVL